MANPDKVDGPWKRDAQALGVLYEATQLISHTLDLNQLLERILDLVFRALQADRGCILLRREDRAAEGGDAGSSAEFEPRAIRWREGKPPSEKLPISRTIVDYVLREKTGILVNDALRDERFQAVQSIVRSGIREVICVPMKGRHQTLGVLYLDTSTATARASSSWLLGKFTGGHLSLAIAFAHQAALAVEETRYYEAMVNAERLAAVGQTVAALSHHIKNILQGLMTGGSVLEQGIKDHDEDLLQKGWKIVRSNQGKVHNLVMDMLTYSKEREPNIESCDLNALARDVVDLLQPRAKELGVELAARLDESLPKAAADTEGIHRALLNVVGNALDAVEEAESPQVLVGSSRESGGDAGGWLRLQVKDNGQGIAADKLNDIFRPFVSTKGARGTGLGLAVSRKLLREHGGDLVAPGRPAKGT